MFKDWIFKEADQDFHWFMVPGTGKIKDFYNSPNVPDRMEKFREFRSLAERELQRLDPTLASTLKPDFKNLLINWLTAQLYVMVWTYHLFHAGQAKFFEQKFWDAISPVLHGNVTNPKFWQSLQKVDANGVPVINFSNLAKDTKTLQRQAASGQQEGDVSRVGPEGRVVLQYPDGFKWLSLDRAYCELEGKAGRHCGNLAGTKRKDDVILSLRNPQNEIEATFVVNKGRLMEAKGPGNTKLNERFFPFVAHLFLASGPPPLPITSMNYQNEQAFRPELDTTVFDLLASDNVEEPLKQALINKFANEIKNPDTVEAYLSNEMDDAHRTKIIKLAYPSYSQEKQAKEFEDSKRLAGNKALYRSQFLGPLDSMIQNWTKHANELTQVIDYDIKEVKRFLNGRWSDYAKHLSFYNRDDRGLADQLRELNDAISMFIPRMFLQGYGFDRDEKRAVDSPERRQIAKPLKKLVQIALQFADEVLGEIERLNNAGYEMGNRGYVDSNKKMVRFFGHPSLVQINAIQLKRYCEELLATPVVKESIGDPCSVHALSELFNIDRNALLRVLNKYGLGSDDEGGIRLANLTLALDELGIRWNIKQTKSLYGKTPLQVREEGGLPGKHILVLTGHVMPMYNGNLSNFCGHGNEPIKAVLSVQ